MVHEDSRGFPLPSNGDFLFALLYAGYQPPAAGALSGEAPAYHYLPISLEGFSVAPVLAGPLAEVGLTRIRARRLGGGAVALHVGRRSFDSR